MSSDRLAEGDLAQVAAQRKWMPQLALMLDQVKLSYRHAARFQALFDRAAHVWGLWCDYFDRHAIRHGPEAAACRKRHVLDALQRLEHIAWEHPAAVVLDGQPQLSKQIAGRGHVA